MSGDGTSHPFFAALDPAALILKPRHLMRTLCRLVRECETVEIHCNEKVSLSEIRLCGSGTLREEVPRPSGP